MLLQVLYKHLISLVEQNVILIDGAMHGDLTFDKLLVYIKEGAKLNLDGSGIIIAC